MQNPDGTTTCDRCGVELEGYGVINGMVCSDVDKNGSITMRIFCYVNGCRDAVVKATNAYRAKQEGS